MVPVVMAGGAGVRFWPLSTEARPKQFITALTERSLYQMTVERALALAPARARAGHDQRRADLLGARAEP